MGIRKIVLTSLVSVSLSASAIPIQTPACGIDVDAVEGLRNIVRAAASVPLDGRGTLTVKGPELGITPAEDSLLRASTGRLVCEPKGDYPGAVSSAAIVGSGDQLLTVAHAFMHDKVMPNPLPDCYFSPHSSSDMKYYLNLSTRNNTFGTSQLLDLDPMDFAIVRLQAPIPGAQPLPFRDSYIDESSQVFVVSAKQEDLPHIPRSEPIVQTCINQRSYEQPNLPTQYYTTCDLASGGSGSIVLVRDRSGNLVINGVMTNGRGAISDEAFSYKDGVFARALGTNGPIHDAISTVQTAEL